MVSSIHSTHFIALLLLGQKLEKFFHWFFGRIEDTIISFWNFLTFKDHVIEKHRVCRKSYYGKPRNHQCHVCRLMFETKEDCNVHKCRFDCNMAGVEKWGKSHCDVCNLDFAGRDLLLNHNLTYHVTEKKFACDLCDFKVIF